MPPSGAVYNNLFATRWEEDREGSEWWALQQGAVSVSTLHTWPEGHPLCFKDSVMAAALVQGPSGLPKWLQSTRVPAATVPVNN